LTTVFIVIVSLVFVFWVVRYVDFIKARREGPFLEADAAAPPPDPAPMISVLIPARNEAANIRRTLEKLLSQNYPAFEVIVADDRSEDDTPRILREFAAKDPRVQSLEFRDLPEGWTGKNHVLWQCARKARGEILLLLDADVALDPGALPVMTDYFLEHRLDMLSLLLRGESSSFWEQAVGPITVTALMLRFPPEKVNDPKSRVAFAAGQVLMIRTDVYRAVGGHESVRSFLLEDMALARRVKRHGYRLHLAYGFDLAATRMYSSLGEFYRGWTRIFYCTLQGSIRRLFAGALFLVLFTLFPYVALIFAAARLATGAHDTRLLVLLVLSVVQIAVMMSLMTGLIRMGRGIPLYVVMHLPAGVIATAIFLSAIAKRFSKKITWKGTSYDIRTDRCDALPDVPDQAGRFQ
jgi:chlorobactene glucosyltransferase